MLDCACAIYGLNLTFGRKPFLPSGQLVTCSIPWWLGHVTLMTKHFAVIYWRNINHAHTLQSAGLFMWYLHYDPLLLIGNHACLAVSKSQVRFPGDWVTLKTKHFAVIYWRSINHAHTHQNAGLFMCYLRIKSDFW